MGRHAPLAEPPTRRPDAVDEVEVEDAPPPRPRRRRAPLWTKAFIAVGAILLMGSTAAFAGGRLLGNRYENSVQRDDLLGDSAPTTNEPAKVEGPLTFLVIGSDSRAGKNRNPGSADGLGYGIVGERSDSIILMHVPKSMDRAYVISIPRDTYVPIAKKDGTGIAGKNKINAAFAFGGAQQLVKTVNLMGNIKIDYPVIVDFNAVREITNLVGGVDVIVDQTVIDPYRKLARNTKYPYTLRNGERLLTFKKGPLHLDGQMAEYYVRQREGLPNGDLDRAKRQQQFLRALMTKAVSGGMVTNPAKFDKLVVTIAGALTVDKRMPVQGLAFSLKSLRPSDLVFMTVPVAGFGNEPGAGSVVYPDKAKSAELFTALRNETLDQYILKYGANDVTRGS
jgi:LCP family protein required for cell wall assembly